MYRGTALYAWLTDNGIISDRHILLTSDQWTEASRASLLATIVSGRARIPIAHLCLGKVVVVQDTLGM